jgi:hypothetical protein
MSLTMARLSPFMIPTSFADLELTADGPTVQAVAPIAFGFTYAGIAFEARADRSEEAPKLSIRGQVGKLPFSAEGVQRRTDLKSIIMASREMTVCRLTLDQHQEIWLDADIDVETPMTPTSLIAATAAVIARCKPWLDMLRFYLVPAASAASANWQKRAR